VPLLARTPQNAQIPEKSLGGVRASSATPPPEIVQVYLATMTSPVNPPHAAGTMGVVSVGRTFGRLGARPSPAICRMSDCRPEGSACATRRLPRCPQTVATLLAADPARFSSVCVVKAPGYYSLWTASARQAARKWARVLSVGPRERWPGGGVDLLLPKPRDAPISRVGPLASLAVWPI
jgi:hypothetical protein